MKYKCDIFSSWFFSYKIFIFKLKLRQQNRVSEYFKAFISKDSKSETDIKRPIFKAITHACAGFSDKPSDIEKVTAFGILPDFHKVSLDQF